MKKQNEMLKIILFTVIVILLINLLNTIVSLFFLGSGSSTASGYISIIFSVLRFLTLIIAGYWLTTKTKSKKLLFSIITGLSIGILLSIIEIAFTLVSLNSKPNITIPGEFNMETIEKINGSIRTNMIKNNLAKLPSNLVLYVAFVTGGQILYRYTTREVKK